jgi:hypothetical protein
MMWVGHMGQIGEKINAYMGLKGKPEGNKP